MKVLVKKVYHYNSERGVFECEIEFYIPAKDYGYLENSIRSFRKFLNDKLDSTWGTGTRVGDENYRMKRVTLRNLSKEGLKEEVEAFIKARLKELEIIVEEDRRKRMEVPEEAMLEFEI